MGLLGVLVAVGFFRMAVGRCCYLKQRGYLEQSQVFQMIGIKAVVKIKNFIFLAIYALALLFLQVL